MIKALFLDRDGTLILPKPYLGDPAGVELVPGAAQSLLRARELGYGLFLFTNQSGIGRGFYTFEDAVRVNARMEELLAIPRPVFDGICMAPEAPGQPVVYRKPSPRYILETLAERGLDPTQCWMVGDSAPDIAAAIAARIRAALVRTGNGDPGTIPEVALHRIPIFDSLPAFVASLPG
jgi:D-glycero-D-manno-heptose 1,7-bisphosphate phosphatase